VQVASEELEISQACFLGVNVATLLPDGNKKALDATTITLDAMANAEFPITFRVICALFD